MVIDGDHDEPGAWRHARRVRRAAWGNGSAATPTSRPRPTQLEWLQSRVTASLTDPAPAAAAPPASGVPADGGWPPGCRRPHRPVPRQGRTCRPWAAGSICSCGWVKPGPPGCSPTTSSVRRSPTCWRPRRHIRDQRDRSGQHHAAGEHLEVSADSTPRGWHSRPWSTCPATPVAASSRVGAAHPPAERADAARGQLVQWSVDGRMAAMRGRSGGPRRTCPVGRPLHAGG
jgi:hypothetical protein